MRLAEPAAYLADHLLVDRCVDGDAAAARDLFRGHQRRVHATLHRVLGASRDMDDLVQEAFVQVFRSLPSFRGEARLSTWIDRITVRVAYRHIARSKRNGPTLEVVDEPSLESGPRDRAIAREGVRRLYAALAELTPAARVAFALHEIDGRSVAEVAKVVGASVTATKLRIWRARRALFRRAAADPVLAELLVESTGEEESP